MTRLSDLLAVAMETRLTVRELAALEFLSRQPGTSVREMADALKMSKPACTRVHHRLAVDGLLVSEPSKADARLVVLTPTNEGRRIVSRLVEAAFS